MNKSVCKVNLGEILYWLFFMSLFLAKGLGLYDGQTVFKLILIFAVICLAGKLCIESYTIGEYVKILLVLAVTGVTYLTSGEKGLLLYGLVMIGMKYVNVKRLFTIGTVVWSLSFFLITVTSLLHMEDTVFKVHAKLGLGHIFRWSLGYPHPNVLQVSYFILAILVIYILGENFRLKHALWLFAGNCLVFLYSVSYTGFIVFTVLLAGRIYLYFRKRLCLIEKGILCLIYPCCVLLSLLAPIKVTGEWFNILNKLLSTRMELGWWYLKPENYSLFGLRIADIVTSSLTMDNAYLFGFIAYGIIPFMLLSLGILYAVSHYLKRDQYTEALIIIAITVGGLTEPFLFNTSFKNLSFVFMGALLFGETKEGRGISPLERWNKEIELPIGGLMNAAGYLRNLLPFKRIRFFGGIVGAALICLIVQLLAAYPEGYVVRRDDCADVTKEIHYYKEGDPAYEGYKQMGVFRQGEEIEYFSGNIVKMEIVRNVVISIVMGYAAGYMITGVYAVLISRKRMERKY